MTKQLRSSSRRVAQQMRCAVPPQLHAGLGTAASWAASRSTCGCPNCVDCCLLPCCSPNAHLSTSSGSNCCLAAVKRCGRSCQPAATPKSAAWGRAGEAGRHAHREPREGHAASIAACAPCACTLHPFGRLASTGAAPGPAPTWVLHSSRLPGAASRPQLYPTMMRLQPRHDTMRSSMPAAKRPRTVSDLGGRGTGGQGRVSRVLGASASHCQSSFAGQLPMEPKVPRCPHLSMNRHCCTWDRVQSTTGSSPARTATASRRRCRRRWAGLALSGGLRDVGPHALATQQGSRGASCRRGIVQGRQLSGSSGSGFPLSSRVLQCRDHLLTCRTGLGRPTLGKWRRAAVEGPMPACCGVDRRYPTRQHCTEQPSRGGALLKHRAKPGSRGGPQAGSWWPRLRAAAAWHSSGKSAGAGAQPAGARPSACSSGAECGAPRRLIGLHGESADDKARGAASGAGRPQPAAGGREPGGGVLRSACCYRITPNSMSLYLLLQSQSTECCGQERRSATCQSSQQAGGGGEPQRGQPCRAKL